MLQDLRFGYISLSDCESLHQPGQVSDGCSGLGVKEQFQAHAEDIIDEPVTGRLMNVNPVRSTGTFQVL